MTNAGPFESVFWVAYGLGHSGGYIERKDAEAVVAANRAIDSPSDLYVWAGDFDALQVRLAAQQELVGRLAEALRGQHVGYQLAVGANDDLPHNLCGVCALLAEVVQPR